VSKSGKQWWSANLHFINTEDLSTSYFNGSHGKAIKSCIECEYAPGKSPFCVPGLDGSGIFACCVAGARCPVNHPENRAKRSYFLQTNLTWTTDIEKVTPISVAVIDGVPCGTLQNLYPGKSHEGTVCDDKLCFTNVTRQMPFSGTIHWAYDHQHEGAVNATLAVNGVPRCHSYPHFGTSMNHTPGNEQGYIVGFKMCIDPANPDERIHVNKGDNMTLSAYYNIDPDDMRSYPIPGGNHTGIMNLFYMWLVKDSQDTYVCKNNACVSSAVGVPKEQCQAACGPHALEEFDRLV